MTNFYAVRYGKRGKPLTWDNDGGDAVSPNTGLKEWHRSLASVETRTKVLQTKGFDVIQVLKIVSQTKAVEPKFDTTYYGYGY